LKTKKIGNKTFVRIDKGEEIIGSLKRCCRENNINLGIVSGIGAANDIVVGLFDPEKKKYYSKRLTGNFEITTLQGNISEMDGEPYLHLHITLGDEKHNSYGGHLTSAVVSATFEGVIELLDGRIGRKLDENIGLNLMVMD